MKNNTVVKGIQFEGLRVVGKPEELSEKYYKDGADELLYVDAVASLYERNSLHEIVKKTARKNFVPLTVGGGIRKLQDINDILNCGADKVAINTAAMKRPDFLKEAANKYGSQCIVLSIQAKAKGKGKWEAYTETGRERSGKDVFEWLKEAVSLGVGEILLTSIDADGSKKGFDIELYETISKIVKVPLIISGGAGKVEDLIKISENTPPDGIALGSLLHYKMDSIKNIKKRLNNVGVSVRN